METFFDTKSKYDRWIEENKGSIIIIDAVIHSIDSMTLILLTFVRKDR